MFHVLAVGLGGFLGAVARYGLSGFVHRYASGSFPTGTLVVNVSGCLVIGALMCLTEERQLFSASTRLFLLSGFLGSFTTFSTVGYETFAFLRTGEYGAATMNAVANLALGVGAVVLGWIGVRVSGI